MSVIDIKELFDKLGFKKSLLETYCKKTGMSKEKAGIIIDQIVDDQINTLGQTLTSGNVKETDFSRLRDLSLQDFMKDNDKIIKDK